jgi:hypothetical protein
MLDRAMLSQRNSGVVSVVIFGLGLIQTAKATLRKPVRASSPQMGELFPGLARPTASNI